MEAGPTMSYNMVVQRKERNIFTYLVPKKTEKNEENGLLIFESSSFKIELN